MRSSLNLLSVITVALVLQVGLCPALCFARSVESASAQTEDARAPEKAPCHATPHATPDITRNAATHAISSVPARGDVPDGCGMGCDRLGSTALASLANRVGADAPPVAFPSGFFAVPARAEVAAVHLREPAPEPPPRNLLLVKNSFLI